MVRPFFVCLGPVIRRYRVNDLCHLCDNIFGKTAKSGMRADSVFVLGQIHTKRLFPRHIAVLPLNVR